MRTGRSIKTFVPKMTLIALGLGLMLIGPNLFTPSAVKAQGRGGQSNGRQTFGISCGQTKSFGTSNGVESTIKSPRNERDCAIVLQCRKGGLDGQAIGREVILNPKQQVGFFSCPKEADTIVMECATFFMVPEPDCILSYIP